HGAGGALACHPVGLDDPVLAGGVVAVVAGQCLGNDRGDGEPVDATLEEGGDRHLVGGVEPRGGGSTGAARLVGEGQAGKGVDVGSFEGEGGKRRPVDRPEG